jgi:hypothetical protein
MDAATIWISNVPLNTSVLKAWGYWKVKQMGPSERSSDLGGGGVGKMPLKEFWNPGSFLLFCSLTMRRMAFAQPCNPCYDVLTYQGSKAMVDCNL